MSVPTINFKVKKHIVAMFDDLSSLSKEELKERLKLCEEVFFFLVLALDFVALRDGQLNF